MAIDNENPLDALSQTLPASWEGVPFPVTNRTCRGGQDSAAHNYFGVLENRELTGPSGREFSYEIPFRNGVGPGKNEDQLKGRVLFPDLFRAFLDAFNDPTARVLVDPVHGRVNCKAGTVEDVLNGDSRDGVTVRATFFESNDNVDGTAPKPDEPAPITGIAQAADALDAQLAALTPPITDSEGNAFTSFAQLGAQLRAPFDTMTLLSMRVGNVIAAFTGELQRLKESVDRLNDVNLWPIANAIAELQSFVYDVADASQRERAKLSRYLVPRDMTLGAILTFLGVDFDTTVQLNPTICDYPLVPEGTAVIYKRAA
jgi:hypothetical protein